VSSAAGTALRAESATREKRHGSSGRHFGLGDLDLAAVRTWVLAGGLVLYLAADGGGYDQVVYSQVGIVVWWLVLLGAAAGFLPRTRLTSAAWAALALFGAFVAWTALSSLWSLSTERSLQDTSLVATYLGILVLGVVTHRERRVAVRHTVQALAAVIVFVAALALASRLIPGLFPTARQTSSFLPGANGRLSWPLDYWNALAALMALGLPLVLAIATNAETVAGQAAAAAGLPLLALCAYLTFSRGGAIAMAAAVLAFFAFTSERIPKLATALVAAGASAALIASAVSRPAIEKGLHNADAQHQGGSLIVLVVVLCIAVALAQIAIALFARRVRASRELALPRVPAAALLATALVAVVVAAVALHAPSRLSHAWRDFKKPGAAVLRQNSLAHFGSASGTGRYQLWIVAIHYAGNHLFHGSGAGTFQLIWLSRASYTSYAKNAHSLYFETLAELGIVGLALLAAFLALCLGRAIVYVSRAGQSSRVYAAGLAAALITFCVSAAYEWIWQVPVLPAAFLLLSAAILAPRTKQIWGRGARATVARESRGRERAAGIRARRGRRRSPAIRGGLVLTAAACLVAMAVPLATTSALDRSQAAVSAGDSSAALAAARTAVGIEPGSASAQLQLALVLELRHQIHRALAAARDATRDEPANWSTWLVLSRLEAEAGHASAALTAYRRARSLNPRSSLFARHPFSAHLTRPRAGAARRRRP
jgi:tetratricopeptide (TPR) repeat protein